MLIGLVLGLAVYNAVLLDFPLPIALYRKLLGQPTALRDLKEMDPPLGKSLQQLLDMQGESDPSSEYILQAMNSTGRLLEAQCFILRTPSESHVCA